MEEKQSLSPAQALLADLRRYGVACRLADGKIIITPASALRDDHRERIKAHRDEVVAELTDEQRLDPDGSLADKAADLSHKGPAGVLRALRVGYGFEVVVDLAGAIQVRPVEKVRPIAHIVREMIVPIRQRLVKVLEEERSDPWDYGEAQRLQSNACAHAQGRGRLPGEPWQTIFGAMDEAAAAKSMPCLRRACQAFIWACGER